VQQYLFTSKSLNSHAQQKHMHLPAFAVACLTWCELLHLEPQQEHIRAHGGIVTTVTVQPSSLKAYLADPASKHKPYSCSTAAAAASSSQQHAGNEALHSTSVFVIGYDNVRNFWIAKAAQGREFGSNGFLRIAYGECGIMDPTRTFGVQFKRTGGSTAPAAAAGSSSNSAVLPTAAATPGLLYRKALQPVPPGKPANCRLYNAGSFDYVSRIARVLGVPVETVLADNAEEIWDLNEPLIGKQLLVCAKRAGPR
jgi:hypothetical protein